jgi:hypothetical protein
METVPALFESVMYLTYERRKKMQGRNKKKEIERLMYNLIFGNPSPTLFIPKSTVYYRVKKSSPITHL